MLDDQITELRRELASRPGDPHALARLAGLLARAGRPEESAECLMKVLARESTDAAASRSLMALTRGALAEKGRDRRILETARVWRPISSAVVIPVRDENRVRARKRLAMAVGIGALIVWGVALFHWMFRAGGMVNDGGGWLPAYLMLLGGALFVLGFVLHCVADVGLVIAPAKNRAFLIASGRPRAGARRPGAVDLREIRLVKSLNPEIDDAPQRLYLDIGDVRALLKSSKSRREIERYEEMFAEFLARGRVEGYDDAEEMIRRSGTDR